MERCANYREWVYTLNMNNIRWKYIKKVCRKYGKQNYYIEYRLMADDRYYRLDLWCKRKEDGRCNIKCDKLSKAPEIIDLENIDEE